MSAALDVQVSAVTVHMSLLSHVRQFDCVNILHTADINMKCITSLPMPTVVW